MRIKKVTPGVGFYDNRYSFDLYDAVVDAAGGGDYTDIQSAIDAGALSIFVRDGSYTLTEDLILVANTKIIGENNTVTIIDTDTFQITVDNVEECVLSNLQIRGTNSNGSVDTNSTNGGLIINNVWFSQNKLPLRLSGPPVGFNIIENCLFSNAGAGAAEAIALSGSYLIQGCRFLYNNVNVRYKDIAGKSHGCKENYYSNNFTLNGETRIDSSTARILINANSFFPSSGTRAINLLDGDISVSNNFFQGAHPDLDPSETIIYLGGDRANLSNNNLLHHKFSIEVAMTNSIISGNIIRSTDSDGININGNFDKTIIQGNRITDCGGYGINIASNLANDTIIIGNNIAGNTTGALNDTGTNTQIGLNITS